MATNSDATPQRPTAAPGPEYWRGPEAWTDSPEFREMLAREFPDDADQWTDPVTRRRFLQLMGASLALAGVTGCSVRPAPQRHILPYTTQPEGVTPGVPIYFATAMPLAGAAVGVLVKSQEGRPIKIEGNPSHPASLGSTDVYTQGSVLDLYDPDRSRAINYLGEARSWEEFLSDFRRQLYGDARLQGQQRRGGAGLRLLSETVTSPTLSAQIDALLTAFPDARWVQYDPAGSGAADGARQAFGQPVNTVYDFSKADVVLALDADFLHCGPGSVRYSRDFSRRRRVRTHHEDGGGAKEMNRLYVVEPMLTSTGAVADHRLPLKASQVEDFAKALAAELKVAGAAAGGQLPEQARAWIAPLARDLQKSAGRCVVIAGEGQPGSVHALAHAINDALKNVGDKGTVRYTQPTAYRPRNQKEPTRQIDDLRALVEDMRAGRVEVLVTIGSNPVYNTPADLNFAAAMEPVRYRVHLGQHQDETAALCHWHVPEAHYLESWGDCRAHDGTVSLQQPLIAPLYDGRTAVELIASILPAPTDEALRVRAPREIVRDHWRGSFEQQKHAGGEFDAWWSRALREGVVPDTAAAAADVKLGANWSKSDGPRPAGGPYEINFRVDSALHDGRYANNGWLMELPRPVTKLTWDNAAIMSPRTAEKVGLASPWPRWTAGERGRAQTEFVTLRYKGREVRAAAWILPGHADDVITVHLGYGRERPNLRVAYDPQKGEPHGFSAYKLRDSTAPWFDGGLEVAKTGDTAYLACTQMHHSMEERKPVRHLGVKDLGDRKKVAAALQPAASSGENPLIKQLVPGPGESGEPKTEHNGKGHDHPHDHADHDHHHDPRLVPLNMYEGMSQDQKTYPRRWAMAIDLTVCTDCAACVVACQAENNIPVVGKLEVSRAREMHWLRIDRYFRVRGADKDNPENKQELIKDSYRIETFFQPVPCQQCEKAPCEVVCPVAATTHSTDGLNDMVYNRCVGTRYCSNNCPYKVRRFNFLTYADWATDSLKLGRNPDVSVRSRGVMEKCTFCVQRIRFAEIEAEREWSTRPKGAAGRPRIPDGDILTACQAACPNEAIVFGDLGDADSVVRRWKSEPTNYGLLAELNTMPRVSYLAALRNPNDEMPKGA